eukprot:TRINITY_DN6658_c0_g1_i2.p1 TRINITY_DN6658_c0_g1~~TRINITY_DN6658_c0_g1_i2.p1  ORF type:complete len:303 (-),score=51.76 TRINITY_DN6658_c0_g1_i2:52-960(-)
MTTTTFPVANRTYSYGVVGDMGTYIPCGWAVTQQIVEDNKKNPLDMMIHAGDIAYAGVASGADGEIEDIWDVWGNQIEPIASIVPYMFAVGNHEGYYNFTSYRNRFIMPGGNLVANSSATFWYSINHGFVHYVFISTEHDYLVNSPQYNWLKNDLKMASQNQTRKIWPWIIVVGHRPMYSSDHFEYDQHRYGAVFQKNIEPLFQEYGVDVYLSGHMHMYERSWEMKYGKRVQKGEKGVVMVVQGTGGVFPDLEWNSPEPEWSAYRSDDWGYGRMRVSEKELNYEFLHQENGDIVDRFSIVKS